MTISQIPRLSYTQSDHPRCIYCNKYISEDRTHYRKVTRFCSDKCAKRSHTDKKMKEEILLLSKGNNND